jgi:signal recognition particle subunit SRP54
MFNTLQQKLDSAFSILRKKSKLTAEDIDGALREVRLALLEADVNFNVVKDFCDRIAEKAKGEEILKSLSPTEQVINIVHEELVATVGEGSEDLNLRVAPPAIILLAGLQGAGKTTTCAKLGLYLKREKKKKALLVSADVYRPAAITQLEKLCESLKLDFFKSDASQKPLDIVKAAKEYAQKKLYDALIIDTAGRLQIDKDLMKELQDIADFAKPNDTLLVADAMTGQEAVNVAKGFNETLNLTGLILTKLDGDARGGAALSMRAVTNRPIKFISVGEKADQLELFHPERLASRILGMGDVLSLIEKAKKNITDAEALDLERKIKKNAFTLEDFLEQMRKMAQMGNLKSIAGMLPGMDKISNQINFDEAEQRKRKVEAIILSMTPAERKDHELLDGSRKVRIAKGSGTSVEEVNRLLREFLAMKKMMSEFSKKGIRGMASMVRNMQKGMSGFPANDPNARRR